MAELTVESGPLRGQNLSFSEDESVVIGSDEDCTLCLQDPAVAGQHLVIKPLKSGGFGIKKLEAGFFLNGQSTEAARLRDGDLLELGSVRVRFGPARTAAPRSATRPAAVSVQGYEILEVLGKGGNGTVYRAKQLSLHREVALKILRADLTENPEFVGRFVAEARAAARLSHPNVVQVFDVGNDGDTYYLSMEIMDQGSLEDRMRAGEGRIPVEECLGHMIDAAKGLAYAESMRIVHRDIKPDNLMIDAHGVVKIADLGLALSDNDERGKIVGTPHFMSPEQALNKSIDHRSDLYSLGCTFFRLVTGRTLFPRKTTKEILTAHVKSEPESADDVESSVPAAVAEIIDRLVEKDPDDRYQGAQELVEDLIAVLQPPSRRGLLYGAIAVLVLGLGFAIYWNMTREEKTTVVKIQTGDPAKTEAMRLQLLQTNAKLKFKEIQDLKLPPLQLAARLEALATDAEFRDTEAAKLAGVRAKEIREAEAARVAAAKALAAKVESTVATLRKSVEPKIASGDFAAAVQDLKLEGVAGEVKTEKAVQAAVQELSDRLGAEADKRLAALRGNIEAAIQAKDPEALQQGLQALDKVLARGPGGWPDLAFRDRPALAAWAQKQASRVEELRAELLRSKQSSAWANFYRLTTGPKGALASTFELDFATAVQAAQQAVEEATGFACEPAARQIQATVQAAKSYHDAFLAAITAGEVQVPYAIDGAETLVKATGWKAPGPDTTPVTAGLQVALPGDPPTGHISLTAMRGDLMPRMFPALQGQPAADRLAFLSLQLLWVHLDASRAYLKSIDPKDPASGTGDKAYRNNVALITVVLEGLGAQSTPWSKFLEAELRASRELSRGLTAFSLRQYTRAANYLETVKKQYPDTLAVRIAR